MALKDALAHVFEEPTPIHQEDWKRAWRPIRTGAATPHPLGRAAPWTRQVIPSWDHPGPCANTRCQGGDKTDQESPSASVRHPHFGTGAKWALRRHHPGATGKKTIFPSQLMPDMPSQPGLPPASAHITADRHRRVHPFLKPSGDAFHPMRRHPLEGIASSSALPALCGRFETWKPAPPCNGRAMAHRFQKKKAGISFLAHPSAVNTHHGLANALLLPDARLPWNRVLWTPGQAKLPVRDLFRRGRHDKGSLAGSAAFFTVLGVPSVTQPQSAQVIWNAVPRRLRDTSMLPNHPGDAGDMLGGVYGGVLAVIPVRSGGHPPFFLKLIGMKTTVLIFWTCALPPQNRHPGYHNDLRLGKSGQGYLAELSRSHPVVFQHLPHVLTADRRAGFALRKVNRAVRRVSTLYSYHHHRFGSIDTRPSTSPTSSENLLSADFSTHGRNSKSVDLRTS